ncbi:MAG: hypothetical protein GC149_01255 [Gammaproteobacteria bacterium]|nr:hypothetical protein [Gammaproteobacteria bacterium]
MENQKIIISLYVSIFVGLTLYVAKMVFFTIHGDEPWFAEQAYWLVKDGVVRSEFFSSVLNYGTQQFAYHKLHIWIAALAIKLFGLSFLVLKIIALSFFCIFIVISRRYFYIFHEKQAKHIFVVFLAFMFINTIALEMFFVYRPEIAIMCFGFISYLFVRKTMYGRVEYSLLAGIFAGLCALLHLNGVIFIAAGAVLLFASKKYQQLMWFCLAAMVVASFYFVDILPHHWSAYWMQFRHDPAIPESKFSVQSLLLQIVFEYERFFGHGYESGYGLLLLAVLIANGKTIWRQTELRYVLIYFLALTLVLAAISPGKKHYYLLFGIPYAGILISVTLWQAFSHIRNSSRNKILTGFAVLYVLANIPHALAMINDGREEIPTPRVNTAAMKEFKIHDGDKVLAPLSFIFNSLEQVNIHGVDAYFMRARRGMVVFSASTFFHEAKGTDRKFILLDRWQLQGLKLKPVVGETVHGYTFLGSGHGYYVYKRTF